MFIFSSYHKFEFFFKSIGYEGQKFFPVMMNHLFLKSQGLLTYDHKAINIHYRRPHVKMFVLKYLPFHLKL